MSKHHREEEKLVATLTQEQRETIKKENPFRFERDAMIYELIKRGVRYPLLAELSGLSTASIGRIATTKINYGHRTHRKSEVTMLDYKKLRKAFEAFYDELLTIVTTGKGKTEDGR